MGRRYRKHRKSNHHENNIRVIVTKAGNADDMPCSRNLRQFPAKSEPISSSQFNLNVKNKKAPKNNAKKKKKRNTKNLEPITEWVENSILENNLCVTFPSAKMTSVAFFIPLEVDFYCNCDFNENMNNFMDWNRLIFYGSNSSSMFSNYNNKRKNSTQHKSMVLEFPQLRKSRSSSESSINSDDSFICFEITDDYDSDDQIRYAEDISDKNYSVDTPDIPNTPDPQPTSKKRKRVHFADDSELTSVHVIIAWDFAYRAARISPWETAARDANRFKLKIQSMEPKIAPVLDPEHRLKIWHDRMEKFYK